MTGRELQFFWRTIRIVPTNLPGLDPNCWLWSGATGGTKKLKYGVYLSQSAHRAAYKHFVGAIPVGHDLDHRCYHTLCVNPAHLEPVTRSENLRRRRK